MLSQTAGFEVGMPAPETDMVKRFIQAGGEGQKQLRYRNPSGKQSVQGLSMNSPGICLLSDTLLAKFGRHCYPLQACARDAVWPAMGVGQKCGETDVSRESPSVLGENWRSSAALLSSCMGDLELSLL